MVWDMMNKELNESARSLVEHFFAPPADAISQQHEPNITLIASVSEHDGPLPNSTHVSQGPGDTFGYRILEI